MGAESEPVIGEDGMSAASSDMSHVAAVPETESEIRADPEMPTAQGAERAAGTGAAPANEHDTDAREPLLPTDSAGSYRERWERIQSRFVDDPRNSVEQADELVVEVVHDLQESFVSERRTLEAQWQRGDDVETEDLRMALKRYRSFFDRLLSA